MWLVFWMTALAIVVRGSLSAGTNVWTSIGPYGGPVQTIAVAPRNPDTVYAVAGGAIFKSTDGAWNWGRVYTVPASNGADGYFRIVVAIHPNDSNTVYAGIPNAGIFKSTDGGVSWLAASAGLPMPLSIPNATAGTTSFVVGALAIDPVHPETIYASVAVDRQPPNTPAPKLFKSTDGGASWRAIGSGLIVDLSDPNTNHLDPYLFADLLMIDPKDPNTVYAAPAGDIPQGGGLFKSTDGGESWIASGTGLAGLGVSALGVSALAINPRNPNTLYAATGLGIYKSTDGGASWSGASSGLPTLGQPPAAPAIPPAIASLAIDPLDPDTIYASRRTCMPCTPTNAVFKSTDGGTNWTGSGLASEVLTSPCCSFPIVLAIDPVNPNRVYAGTYDGIQTSLDGGESWNPGNAGLTAGQIDALTLDPQNAGALFVTYQGRVSRTTDGGAHWSEIYTPLLSDDARATYPASTLVADPGAPGTYYVAIGGNADGGGGILKSTDGGANWKRMPLPGDGGVRELVMNPQNPGTLYAMVPNHALYKSADDGASWSVIAGQKEMAGFGDAPCFSSFAIDQQNPSTMYLGTCRAGSGLSKSTDGGQTWSAFIHPAYGFVALTIDPQNSGTVYAADLNSVFKTTDGGQSWRTFSAGLPFPASIRSLAVHPRNSSIVYAGSSLGVFWSTNGGTNWSPLNAGLTNVSVQTLLIDPRNPDTVYAGTYGGGIFAMTFPQ